MSSSRRSVLQALAVLPVVGLLLPRGAEAQAPKTMKTELIILPQGGKFEPFFQRACSEWLLEHPGYRPVGDLYFEPCLWDTSPWLLHPSWTTPDSPLTLVTPAEEAFRRPTIIDRAVALRAHLYWREDNVPVNYSDVTQAVLDDRWARWRAWRAEQRLRLAYVVVKFDAERVDPDPETVVVPA